MEQHTVRLSVPLGEMPRRANRGRSPIATRRARATGHTWADIATWAHVNPKLSTRKYAKILNGAPWSQSCRQANWRPSRSGRSRYVMCPREPGICDGPVSVHGWAVWDTGRMLPAVRLGLEPQTPHSSAPRPARRQRQPRWSFSSANTRDHESRAHPCARRDLRPSQPLQPQLADRPLWH